MTSLTAGITHRQNAKVKKKYPMPSQNVMLGSNNGFIVRTVYDTTGLNILPTSLSDLLPEPRLSHLNRVLIGFRAFVV